VEAETFNSNLTNQLDEFKTKLEESNSVKNDLKKQLESKEELLQSDNKKQKELQTTIDGVKKTVGLLKWASKWLCEHPKDVSTCKVEFVTIRSLRYLSQVSQTWDKSNVSWKVLLPSSGSHLENGFMSLVYMFTVLFWF
jgi:myosin heavy subunit